ncbi:hypothetical protein [Nocardia transvalensis]|uniref:hypothetical protein n=1 Tax=Nocardia transvalensis TaxID=37333 RepID=UPI001893EDC5|nr:hypothetical protein [Nocardia transvalensis]MBF6334086.1 hypothetical protein [Nocardia transvalensis]
MSPRTTRPGLAGAIRLVAAATVVGSAVAVTALTVQNDQVSSVVVTDGARESSTGAAGGGDAGAAGKGEAGAGTPPLASGNPSSTAAHGSSGGTGTGTAPGAPGNSSSGTAPGSANSAAPAAPAGRGGVPSSVPINPGNSGPAATVPLNQSAPGTSAAPGTSTPGNPGASTPISPGSSPGGSVPLADNPFATATANTQPACPLGWPAPKQQGGLASLIGLAPLAGPFSSEAFALGSVYQPILQLAGPVLAEIAPVIARNQPAIDPIITQVQGAEAVVLQAILPYYGPYRGQLIAAEGELAKQLAPILDRVYNSEAASCFVAWQGQLIDQAKGGPLRVPSLAHPGTVVELDPKP